MSELMNSTPKVLKILVASSSDETTDKTGFKKHEYFNNDNGYRNKKYTR